MRLLILLLTWTSSALAQICTRVQACEAKLNVYPQIEELEAIPTIAPIQESSGWGSGMVPLYDEFLETIPFDYSQTPEVQTHSLCSCTGNNTCDSSDESKVVKLDESIQLTFCEDVRTQFSSTCRGGRGRNRVIGPADESGRSISAVISTLVFCTCPSGYQRNAPEVWQGSQLSIQYTCK